MDANATLIQRRMSQLAVTRPYIRPEFFQAQPVGAQPFIQQSNPYVNYPLPGAAAVTVLTYTVPRGQQAKITYLSIVHVGGGFLDGTGNVIWRVLINGAAHKGLGNLSAQIGTTAQPNPVQILLAENDVVTVTIEVPAAAPVQPGSTGAQFQGYTMPVAKGV